MPPKTDMTPRKKTLKKILRVLFGLIIGGCGCFLTIQANIGLAPWECLTQGISKHVSASYGTCYTVIGLIIVVIDLLLKEKIGLGTILDALIIGPVVDILTKIIPFPVITEWYKGVPIMIAGLFIVAFSLFLYQGAGLSFGPRDAFVIAIGKRLRKLSIGTVQIMILAIVLASGWLLGGKVGIGTVIGAFGTGIAVNIVFRILRFEPRDIVQDDVFTSLRKLVRDR